MVGFVVGVFGCTQCVLEICNEHIPGKLGTILGVRPVAYETAVGLAHSFTHLFDEGSMNGSAWSVSGGGVVEGSEGVDEEVDAVVGGVGSVSAESREVTVLGEVEVAGSGCD